MIASDEMGEAAAVAAQFATALGFHLHAAASDRLGRAERAEQARKAFAQWAPLIRCMAEVAAVAPVAAARAEAQAERHADFVEASLVSRSGASAPSTLVQPPPTR